MPDRQNDFPVVIVDTSRSPYARLRPVPLTDVIFTDSFWAPRLRLNRDVVLPSQYRLLEESGRIDNFRRAAGKVSRPFRGLVFNDSDVYKWLEAAAWALAAGKDAALSRMLDAVVTEVSGAQQPDGYLNTYYTFERAGERWSNLRDQHELYCAGHLIQAAIAHRRATGEERLLDVARRFADHICDTFGAEEGKRPGTTGHPELEMALVELARLTGEARYLAQARYFLDVRGHGVIGGQAYHLDHLPLREMEQLVGHAVRAVYLTAGATDLCSETGEPALREALERLWARMVARQMYITGGIGARCEGEAFGADYELPNARAYAETCAAIANVMWAWRMLQLDGDARYADVMELALYNGALPGLSLDGAAYFYVNPLSGDGAHRRQEWFGCACCPPNIARLLAALPGYVYSVSDAKVWVHLYAEGEAQVTLPDGRHVQLSQHTRYPWEGTLSIGVMGEGEFSLMLRIPAWCETGGMLAVNNESFAGTLTPGAYAEIRRQWSPGDVLILRLPMAVRRVAAHPYALENTGRVALMRGPLLYCLEQADNPGFDLRDVVLPGDSVFSEAYSLNKLGGVVTLRAQAAVSSPDAGWTGRLYRTVRPAAEYSRASAQRGTRLPVEITAIPYYAWANRAPGQMQVWLKAG